MLAVLAMGNKLCKTLYGYEVDDDIVYNKKITPTTFETLHENNLIELQDSTKYVDYYKITEAGKNKFDEFLNG